mmetsp:Transcript_10406/g.15451  ORF Transcript_10406/g.15451 Transcript_10406/m.15451 type:complete len:262 (-) Transcript_10406:157-942(-)
MDVIQQKILSHYYKIDPEKKIVYPGIPKNEDSKKASIWHDYFNLVILVPIITLDALNWDYNTIWHECILRSNNEITHMKDAWTGEFQDQVFNAALCYFLLDTLWMLIAPKSVRSPGTILVHHLACMVYLYLVYVREEFFWFMGACLSVEVNTWFLIARRVVNKQGIPAWNIDLPLGFSLKIKFISICFYATWITLRCVLFPYLLHEVYSSWVESPQDMQLLVKLSMHSLFTFLNLKWTYDLCVSKMNYWRKVGGRSVDKGL